MLTRKKQLIKRVLMFNRRVHLITEKTNFFIVVPLIRQQYFLLILYILCLKNIGTILR